MEHKIHMVCIDRNFAPVVGTRLKLRSPHFIAYEEIYDDEYFDEDFHDWDWSDYYSTPWTFCGSYEAFQEMHPTLKVPPMNWRFYTVYDSEEDTIGHYEIGCDPDPEWLKQRPQIVCKPIDDNNTEAVVVSVHIPEHLKTKLSNYKK